jgi:alpha-L-rhamnosidase
VIPEMLRKQFGDTVTFKKHYPFMKKWMLYMWNKYGTNNLVLQDTYGDWCLPPESLELIFSRDSTRNTKGALIGAAYYYYALQLMKNFASYLNITEDVKQFDDMAIKVKAAFNETFYNQDSGYYANNTVTSNLLPLTFGLAPENDRQRIFDKIVQRTLNMYGGHVSTGLIGGQWLMRGLSDNGRPDLAYKIASNTTYPSWGYMAAQGATTIWELWNGNTANPAMNSGNHVMLLGDLLIWYYEYLAGIKSDNNDVAFKKIIMDPYLAPGLTFVKASTSSPYGAIKSSWKIDKGTFKWDVVIPANSKAIITFPVNNLKEIKESNIAIDQAEGLKFSETKDGKTYIEAGSGRYSFSCPMR